MHLNSVCRLYRQTQTDGKLGIANSHNIYNAMSAVASLGTFSANIPVHSAATACPEQRNQQHHMCCHGLQCVYTTPCTLSLDGCVRNGMPGDGCAVCTLRLCAMRTHFLQWVLCVCIFFPCCVTCSPRVASSKRGASGFCTAINCTYNAMLAGALRPLIAHGLGQSM